MARMLMISVTELVHLHAEKQKDKQTTKPHKKTYRGEYSKDRTD